MPPAKPTAVETKNMYEFSFKPTLNKMSVSLSICDLVSFAIPFTLAMLSVSFLIGTLAKIYSEVSYF